MNLNKPFIIFANCMIVKGANRSSICDLQRGNVKIIPNDLYVILKQYEGKTINAIKLIYENKFDTIIEEYFEFLLKNEFIFFSNNFKDFPKLSMQWHDSSTINNAIIDVNKDSKYSLTEVINQLEHLNCRHIEFRFYDIVSINELENITNYIDSLQSMIISIDLLIPYNKTLEKEIQLFLTNYNRIASIKIYNAPKNEYLPPIRGNMGYMIYNKKNIKSNLSCGVISQQLFVVNIPLFTEGKTHNTCLNCKISIDVDGNIKNCPSMQKSYGNITNTTLKKVLNKTEFKELWNITKDHIEICKDCEFRYICTDCRAFIEKPKNNYSKPLKCGYDPYTNKWQNWKDNKSKKEAIEFYELDEM